MPETRYRDRRAWRIENNELRVTVTVEGGHIAEIFHKGSGVNPLWTPPWQSIEPSTYDRTKHPGYGSDAESKLLAGIMGHNLCLDLFGGVTDEEAAAGMTVHGESSVAPYAVSEEGGALVLRATFPQAQLQFERRIRLDGGVVRIRESATNLTGWDRPSAWTQHVTLGPPFLEGGVTVFRAPGTRSRVFETDFGGDSSPYVPSADFDWPLAPKKGGGTIDLRVYPSSASSGGFTTHLMDPHREHAWFTAWSPKSKLLFGYAWKRTDFPWLGIWEENRSRTQAPWNGRTITRGMEFGASPMPETRRQMIERKPLFGVPGFRWIPAKKTVTLDYVAFARTAAAMEEELDVKPLL